MKKVGERCNIKKKKKSKLAFMGKKKTKITKGESDVGDEEKKKKSGAERKKKCIIK